MWENVLALQNELFNVTLPVIWSIFAITKRGTVIHKGDLMVHCPYNPYYPHDLFEFTWCSPVFGPRWDTTIKTSQMNKIGAKTTK